MPARPTTGASDRAGSAASIFASSRLRRSSRVLQNLPICSAFSFISMTWRAQPLLSYRVIIDLISATTTDTGLSVRCQRDETTYMASVNVERDVFHGDWNYTTRPSTHQTEWLFPDRPLPARLPFLRVAARRQRFRSARGVSDLPDLGLAETRFA